MKKGVGPLSTGPRMYLESSQISSTLGIVTLGFFFSCEKEKIVIVLW